MMVMTMEVTMVNMMMGDGRLDEPYLDQHYSHRTTEDSTNLRPIRPRLIEPTRPRDERLNDFKTVMITMTVTVMMTAMDGCGDGDGDGC